MRVGVSPGSYRVGPLPQLAWWAEVQLRLQPCSPSVVACQTSTSSGLGSSAPPVPWSAGSTVETSGGPDLSDSISSGGVVAQHLPRKVKVNSVLDPLVPGLRSLFGGSGLWMGWE